MAEASGAYPSTTGLLNFERKFTFDGRTTFTVDDTVRLERAAPVQFYLQSDAPIMGTGASFTFGGGPASLDVRFASDLAFAATTAPTVVLAPDKPGSITKGPEDKRGFHLKVETAAATDVRVTTTMVVRGSGDRQIR